MMSSGRVVSHGMTQGRGMMMHRPKACSDIPCSRDEDEDLYDNGDEEDEEEDEEEDDGDEEDNANGDPKPCSDIPCSHDDEESPLFSPLMCPLSILSSFSLIVVPVKMTMTS